MHMLTSQKQRDTNVKLPEVLKLAVEKQDWGVICSLYTKLTGETLYPPKQKEPDYADMYIDLMGTTTAALVETSPTINKDVRKKFLEAEEVDEAVAANLVANEGDNRGEGVPTPDQEIPENMTEFAAPSRSQSPDDGGHWAQRQQMKIPEVRENRFQDDEADAATTPTIAPPAKPRSETKRQALVDVQCSSCGEYQQVAPLFAHGYNKDEMHNTYKCNQCIVSRPATR